MDGLCRVAGCPVPVRILGRTYLANPLTLRDWGACENYLLTRPARPLRKLFLSLESMAAFPDDARALYERFRRQAHITKWLRVVPAKALRAWSGTDEGVYVTAWLCLRQYRRWECLEAVRAAVRRMARDEVLDLVLARDVASGTDLLSETDWPDAIDKFAHMRKEPPPAPAFVPWKNVFRNALEGAFQPFDAVAGLTLYQVRLLTADMNASGNVVQVTPAEAREIHRRRQEVMRGAE